MSAALSRPSLTPSLRVNTLRARPQVVKGAAVDEKQVVVITETVTTTVKNDNLDLDHSQPPQQSQLPHQPPLLRLHPRLPGVLMLYGSGPYDIEWDPGLPEVIVNRYAAEAVLKSLLNHRINLLPCCVLMSN
ncbi:hypothetical protein VOLCADRAFT_100141 [Volvox carteri f. nagariensis]|uniref:Uncharacterized protein n=1 Tax=Volvox carteri f. nagariensis TaxID=3068 RepID=D8UJI5_VOLCA|nr:uncharacterized protein VOLCADRAFT_100141 [Volvox carteri f. nagariensis]EFJ40114.1 hypothetical protein VOLCADRAFT_100141 [Volvox carteri f. nagariensis]|eukprot:XP_002958810.1 hypothetical protein VOLCADRAFT_100141 [Volvox carteri f. nagariensis]